MPIPLDTSSTSLFTSTTANPLFWVTSNITTRLLSYYHVKSRWTRSSWSVSDPPPLRVSLKLPTDIRIQKSKRGNAGKKRSGNNLYGSKGKPKCNACRVARRAVLSPLKKIVPDRHSANLNQRMTPVPTVFAEGWSVARRLAVEELRILFGLVCLNNWLSTIVDGLSWMSLPIWKETMAFSSWPVHLRPIIANCLINCRVIKASSRSIYWIMFTAWTIHSRSTWSLRLLADHNHHSRLMTVQIVRNLLNKKMLLFSRMNPNCLSIPIFYSTPQFRVRLNGRQPWIHSSLFSSPLTVMSMSRFSPLLR